MAKTDALTGLHNRQAAIPKIEERLRAVEAGELGDASCALIMLDLDSFKLANDVFGHAYGDQVIVHVAEALKESFPGDVVCRMGGDEFLVWCEDVDEGALEDRIVERSCSQRRPVTCWFRRRASRSTTCIRKRIRRCSRSRWAASAPARDTGLG